MPKSKIFFVLPIVTVLLILLNYSQVLAQSPSTPSAKPAPVISDYAKDVQEGKQNIVSDAKAQQNQKDQKDNENVNTKEVNQEGVNEIGNKENIENDESQEDASNLNNGGGPDDNKQNMGNQRNNY